MKRKNQDMLLIIRATSDIFNVCLAWVLSYHIRFLPFIPAPKGVPDAVMYYRLVPFIAVIWFVVFAGSGFYKRTGRHRSAFTEGLDIIQNAGLAAVAFVSFTYVYAEYEYSRAVLGLFVIVHPVLMMAGRSAVRKALRWYRRKAPPRRTLMIGGGATLRHALELANVGDLTRTEILGVIEVVDAAVGEQPGDVVDRFHLRRIPVPADWAAFFRENPTESVVIALPHKSYEFLEHHLDKIADQVTDIKLIPDLARFTRFASGVEVVDGTPVVTINESPLAGIGSLVKRLMDIGGSLFGIVLFGPVMACIAVLVKLTSPGPVLYRQERMGLDGRTFMMMKFRSMRVDAESRSGAVWATKDDDRTTPIGKWLRRTSLDELPQLFNVLQGDMSLVGPRPERPVFVDKFRSDVPGYYLRHKTRAGITGWAQVNGWRGSTSIEKRIECDLWYIQNWSLWLDFRIIFLTIFRGFINKNAY